ncbi:MAG: glycine--tRNA ligase subunit beta [Deltaproteobacteria bacterium]|nr:MAG: glycine--tRNA ligase subunit beta [Deltaproteobacteria bacterium]
MAELLFEIGTEEIPSGYLTDALEEFKKLAFEKLKGLRIPVDGGLRTYGTPRRLVLMGEGVYEKQEDIEEEVTGPPKNVAFSPDGEPTKAAIGFAKRQGVALEDLQVKSTPKGDYVCVRRKIEGRPTVEVLAQALPELIAQIPWPKSMRWGNIGFPFVRPIHWILALLDGQVISFEVAGIRSGNKTRGHRFMSPGEIEVSGINDYLEKMKDAWVVVDPVERRSEVLRVAEIAAREAGGLPVPDEELACIVANLVEYPSAVCGSFEERFLALPEVVLITAMREHQRYFAVRDSEGKLIPNFVTINNTIARDPAVVRKGNERVLRARLADADFFFKEDRKRPLIDRLEDLKEVIYQADLGTSYAKVQRFTALAEWLASESCPEKVENIVLASKLCKCDLVTHMVDEFPSLQGKIGEVYARLDGHPEEVCVAIREHYMPLRAGGELPKTLAGSIVGLADRMDTIVGCFAVGLEPTGTADPFALRRHALAILRILESISVPVRLGDFVSRSAELLARDIAFERNTLMGRVLGFFRERYKQMMLRRGYGSAEVEAVISAEFDRIECLKTRVEAVKQFSESSPEFEPLALTFKRVKNILKKADKEYAVDPGLFREKCEKDLWAFYGKFKPEVEEAVNQGDYEKAFETLSKFRNPVDSLFEDVEILTKENDRLRENRLGLLQAIEKLFLLVADFSKFSI